MRFTWSNEDEAVAALQRLHGLRIERWAGGGLVARGEGFALRCGSASKLLHELQQAERQRVDRRHAAG